MMEHRIGRKMLVVLLLSVALVCACGTAAAGRDEPDVSTAEVDMGGGVTGVFDLSKQTLTACLRKIVNPSSPQTVTIPSQITVDGKQYTVTELMLGSNLGSHPAAKNVTGLILPDTITTVNESCFRYFSLSSFTIPGSIKRFNGSFQYCDTLKSLIFEEGVEWIGDTGLTMLTDAAVESIHLPSTLQGFDAQQFNGAESLTEIVLPENITVIPLEAFRDCISLKRVVAKGKITKIEKSAFSGCKSLEEIPDLKYVETMDSYAFNNCSSLFCDVDLSSLKRIPDYAFTYAQVTVTKLCDELISIGEWAFVWGGARPNDGDTLKLPDTLESIGSYNFFSGWMPEKVVLPDSVTKVGIGAFKGSSVEEFDIGCGLIEIEDGAFASDNLKKITIDNSDDGLIGNLPEGADVVYKQPSIVADGDNITPGQTMSLQQAVNQAQPGETITIDKNVKLSETLKIPAGKNIVIRSNGNHIILADKDKAVDTLVTVADGASVTFEGSIQLSGKHNSGGVIDCSGTVRLAGQARVYGSYLDEVAGVIDVHGKGAKLVMTGGEVSDNWMKRDGCAAIRVYDGGQVSIEGGSIHGNQVIGGNWIEASSGILVGENGSAKMTGGIIENNKAYRGSAVTLYSENGDKKAEFTMSGGVIRNNVCRSPITSGVDTDSGGAVYVHGNAKFTLTGNGVITKNQGATGAGVCVLDPERLKGTGDYPTRFIMEGGEISYNQAVVGGGIYSFSNGTELKAGKICYNEANQGGGIYSEGYMTRTGFRNSTLHMTNAAIVNNTSEKQGGGLWFCSTGAATVHVKDGAVVANNKAKGVGDDVVAAEDMLKVGASTTLANRMLGGGKVLWYRDGGIYFPFVSDQVYPSMSQTVPRYGKAGADGTPIQVENSELGLALKAIADASAVQLARNEATLLIENNSARSYGGGVAANGGIVIGEDKDLMDIPVEKTWDHGGNAESKRPVSVTVKLMRGQAVLDTLVLNEENGWKGVFEDLPKYDDYTVVEEPIPNYTVTVSGNAKDGFTLSNVYHPTEEDRPIIPQTGDDSRLLLWGVLLVLALGGVAYLVYRYKKGK